MRNYFLFRGDPSVPDPLISLLGEDHPDPIYFVVHFFTFAALIRS